MNRALYQDDTKEQLLERLLRTEQTLRTLGDIASRVISQRNDLVDTIENGNRCLIIRRDTDAQQVAILIEPFTGERVKP